MAMERLVRAAVVRVAGVPVPALSRVLPPLRLNTDPSPGDCVPEMVRFPPPVRVRVLPAASVCWPEIVAVLPVATFSVPLTDQLRLPDISTEALLVTLNDPTEV